MYFEFFAASIVQLINGFPARSRIFFLDSRLLPPRAGITAKNVFLLYILLHDKFIIGPLILSRHPDVYPILVNREHINLTPIFDLSLK